MTRRVNSFPLSVFFLSQLHLYVYVKVSGPSQVLVSFLQNIALSPAKFIAGPQSKDGTLLDPHTPFVFKDLPLRLFDNFAKQSHQIQNTVHQNTQEGLLQVCGRKTCLIFESNSSKPMRPDSFSQPGLMLVMFGRQRLNLIFFQW